MGTILPTRDFITLDQEYYKTPLFIDGLDEQRASEDDGRTTLDKIRSKLNKLNNPKFRLSCREADWLGSNDKENIKKVSYDGEIKEFQLDPLKPEDIRQILKSEEFNIPDPDQFISQAKINDLTWAINKPTESKNACQGSGT